MSKFVIEIKAYVVDDKKKKTISKSNFKIKDIQHPEQLEFITNNVIPLVRGFLKFGRCID